MTIEIVFENIQNENIETQLGAICQASKPFTINITSFTVTIRTIASNPVTLNLIHGIVLCSRATQQRLLAFVVQTKHTFQFGDTTRLFCIVLMSGCDAAVPVGRCTRVTVRWECIANERKPFETVACVRRSIRKAIRPKQLVQQRF